MMQLLFLVGDSEISCSVLVSFFLLCCRVKQVGFYIDV